MIHTDSKVVREHVTTLTQRGQVTVPAEIRKLLGLKPRDKVAFTVENGEVRIKPVEFTVEFAYRSVKRRHPDLGIDETIELAKEEWVDEMVEKAVRTLSTP